jgi:hypothetical protein
VLASGVDVMCGERLDMARTGTTGDVPVVGRVVVLVELAQGGAGGQDRRTHRPVRPDMRTERGRTHEALGVVSPQ